MTTILLVIAFLIASHFIQWVAWGICLAIGLKWARTAEISAAKITRVTVVTHVVQNTMLVLMAAIAWFGSHAPPLVPLIPIAALAIAMPFIPIWLVYRTFQLPVWRSIQALIPTLLVLAIGYSIAVGVMKPFLCETVVIKDQSDVPILDVDHGPDQVLVGKYRGPQRWDLVAIRSPANPEQAQLMRLVGLPNEKISIKDGAIWADDQPLTPPARIKHLVEVPPRADEPMIIGANEFLVLGDLSTNSANSRSYQVLPRENVIGPAVLVYWPPNRWREF